MNCRDGAVNFAGIRYREAGFANGEKVMTTKSWKRHNKREETTRAMKRKRIKLERLQGIGNSNHGKRKHQRKKTAANEPRTRIEQKPFERRILNNVLRELKSETKNSKEDGCGTRWTKTVREQRSAEFLNFKVDFSLSVK